MNITYTSFSEAFDHSIIYRHCIYVYVVTILLELFIILFQFVVYNTNLRCSTGCEFGPLLISDIHKCNNAMCAVDYKTGKKIKSIPVAQMLREDLNNNS